MQDRDKNALHDRRPRPGNPGHRTQCFLAGLAAALAPKRWKAIAAMLPLGSVGDEDEVNERGERRIWLDYAVVSRLRSLRGGARATAMSSSGSSRQMHPEGGGRANPVDRSHAPDLQCLSSPHHQLVEPRLGGPDDFRVHRLDQPVDRRVFDGLEDPVAMLDPQVLQHGERLLALPR